MLKKLPKDQQRKRNKLPGIHRPNHSYGGPLHNYVRIVHVCAEKQRLCFSAQTWTHCGQLKEYLMLPTQEQGSPTARLLSPQN